MPTATILSKIKESFPEAILDMTEFAGEHIFHVKGRDILTVLTELKADGFNFLADLTAIDNLTLGGLSGLLFLTIYYVTRQRKD